MTALLEQAASGPLASIIKATQRLNPCFELDVDVLAVARAAVASTQADWAAGVLTSTAADANGLLRLSPPTPVSLFSQTNAVTVNHFLKDSSNGIEEYALDFFPDPTITQGVPFTLSSLDLYIGGAQDLKGFYRITVGYYDDSWRLVQMGDYVDILSGDVSAIVGNGGVYTIDFLARGHRYVFPSGMQNTITGSGYDGANVRTSNVDNKNISHLLNIPRGLSISIRPSGAHATSAYIGCVANATAAQFNTALFWRVAANRNCGPYYPVNQPYSGPTTDHNPDNYLVTGAVPGFGAKAVTNGSWGIARRIPTAQRAQNATYTWEQPYHNLKIVSYPSTGSAVNVLDMGATPTNPVELRLDDIQQQGTSLSYVLKGSNTAVTGPWTAISANTDGSILSGADLYRWYQLTTTFTPGPSGATKYASPVLQAWSMVERIALSTYRYLKDVDSTTVADPVTAQSSIGELVLPVMNAGRQDFRDLAAQLGSNYAPSSLEAHVYARNTRNNVRYFLNLFRLENRDPQFGVEEMTFVSGMDRLTIKIPAPVETITYPLTGQVAITNVTNAGANYTITVAGTPFVIGQLVNSRMHGVTGTCAGADYNIVSNATTSQFVINSPNPVPVIGDTFEIHSDITNRSAAPYVGQDFAAIYTDLLAVKAAVPARYRGRLPATQGRTGSYTLPAAGVKALDILQDVALHCLGFPAWDKGRIQFVDFYGPKDSAVTWGDREIVTLETPVGADRRMPSIRVKYGYDPGQQVFANEAVYEDYDTLLGWGRSNLFDIFELPDNFCFWNDLNEAKFIAGKLQSAWKSGVRLWKLKTVLYYPWLSQGDAVTIMTDQYTDRRLAFSADGITDLGIPIAGRTSSLAVIVGKNLWGDEFIVAVRGLDAVTSASSVGAAAKAGSIAKPPLPTPIRGQVWDDGKFAPRASDPFGNNIDPSVVAPSLSQAGTWSSSGVTLNTTAATINDGDVVTNSFHTDTAVPGAYVQVDMGVATTFDNVRIWASTAGSVTIYKVRHSPDGTTWTDTSAIGFNPIFSGWNVIGFTAISRRYWRLELTNTPGAGAWNNEVEFAYAQSLALVNHRPHPVVRYEDMANRTNLGFDTGANLKNNVQQYDNPSANTLAKRSMKGRQSAAGYDTQVVTFPSAFQNIPAMKFSRGSNTITNQPDSTKWPAGFVAGQAQIEDVRASGLTATGFTLVAQLVQTATTTARVGEFTTANSLTTAGSATSFALTNCPSSNGHYTVRYTWSVTVTSNKPGIAATATLVVTINKRAGGASGASTELDRQTYSVTDPDGTGPYTNSSGGPQATDINATLGNTDWLEVKITSFTHTGAILQTDSCVVHGCNITDDGAGNDGESHSNGGTTITTSMTPASKAAAALTTDSVIWEAVSWQ